MNKMLGMGVVAALASAGAVYYVGPDPHEPQGAPPILVEGSPKEVLAKVRRMSVRQYLWHNGERSRDLLLLSSSTKSIDDDTLIAIISFVSDPVLVLRAEARPAGDGKTELEIIAELPDSRFSSQPVLHPHDLKVMATFADFATTDYISSRLTGQRMASDRELEHMVYERARTTEENLEGFADRIQAALRGAYPKEEIAEALAPDNHPTSDWGHDGDGDWDQGWQEPAPQEAWGEREAASEARHAAESARRAAEQAARDAGF